MKIYDGGSLNKLTGEVTAQTQNQGVSGVKPKELSEKVTGSPFGGTQKDRVEISSEARMAARLLEEVKSLPEIRVEVVEQLRSAIQTGQYRIDPVKIAERLIREI